MPKISVVIPVYNVQDYLERCLTSLESQTFTDFEVIIVDDGSPDASYKIYEAYSAKDSRFRYLRKENGGVSRARNAGLSLAVGDYVLFVDSDDWLPENALETLYTKAIETDADLTVADVTIVYDTGGQERVHVFDEDFCTDDREFIDAYKQAILGYAYNPRPFGGRCLTATGLGGPWNKLVKKTFIEEHRLEFDPYVMGIFDDSLYSLDVLANAEKVAYVAKSVYYYRMVKSSLLHKYKPNMLEVNVRIFERIEQYITSCDNPAKYEKPYHFYVVRRFDETLKSYFFAKENPKSFIARIAELKSTIASDPYRLAFASVDYEMLNRSKRAICKQARKGHALSIWVVWLLKKLKDKTQV